MKKNFEGISKTKRFIYKYNCKGINYLSKKDSWKKVKQNNPTINLKVLYAKKEKSYPAYVLKHNSKREKQIFFLMLSSKERAYSYSKKKICIIMKNSAQT